MEDSSERPGLVGFGDDDEWGLAAVGRGDSRFTEDSVVVDVFFWSLLVATSAIDQIFGLVGDVTVGESFAACDEKEREVAAAAEGDTETGEA